MCVYIIKRWKDRVSTSTLPPGYMKKQLDENLVLKEKAIEILTKLSHELPTHTDKPKEHPTNIPMELPPITKQLSLIVIIDYAHNYCTCQQAQVIQHMLYVLVKNPTDVERSAIEGIMTDFIASQKALPQRSLFNYYEEGSQCLVTQGNIDHSQFIK